MHELHIVPDGALLIHNGVIEASGPTHRIENLQEARGRERDRCLGQSGYAGLCRSGRGSDCITHAGLAQFGRNQRNRFAVISRRRLEVGAVAAAAAWARCGVLTVGAHSGYAKDLRETTKVLKIHRSLQGKPLRIRSIFSPRQQAEVKVLIDQWLPPSAG